MDFELFLGVLSAVLIGNGLAVVFFYALFWADAARKRGVPEDRLPWWVYVGGTLPPIIAAIAAKVAIY